MTGVQPVGSSGVSSVQVATVDSKELARLGTAADPDSDRTTSSLRHPDAHQPVVFPREGVPLDRRPVDLRHQQAVARYRGDGGRGGDADADGDAA